MCPRCGLPPPAPVVTGPRHEPTWRQSMPSPPRPGRAYFAIVALASLVLGALLSAWALGLL
ncbi:MAG TPA: hypothetical protein VFU21_07080 [Kofleriaceae bacterium]|nr:hypothetical protein [Kofleriaceae bacterium]